ncbi:MAG: vitamin K epoxide reductase family protein, partial [Bacteroidota bacterium]
MDLKLEKVFTLFLRKNFYFVDEKEAKLQLESHPDFPSLRSVTDTLDYLEIEHLAISVPKEALDQLPDCFLAIIDTKGKEENSLVAAEKKGDAIVVHNVSDKKTMKQTEFLEIWDGVVVAVEPNLEEKGAKPLRGLLTPEVVGIGILLLLLGYVFGAQKPPISTIAYLAASFAGLGVSVLILREEFGQGSKLVDRICNATQATSCQEVLSSKGAKFVGNYGLSDMGLIYFVTAIVAVIFGLVSLSFLTALNILAVPIILYTWFYQAFKVKKWCVLCLVLSAMLIAQLTIGLLASPDFGAIQPASAVNFAVAILIVTLAWIYAKKLLVSSKDGRKSQHDLLKFKKDSRIFQTLLQQGKAVDVASENPNAGLVLGNPRAA